MGRNHLLINGYVVATQGDPCRDPDLRYRFLSNTWTTEMIKHVARQGVTTWLEKTRARILTFRP